MALKRRRSMEPFSKMLPYFDLKCLIISLSVLSKNYQNITKNVSKYYQTILDFVFYFFGSCLEVVFVP